MAADGNMRRIETGELTGVNVLNPYIQGIYEPVAKEVTALDLKVIGELPKDLARRLLSQRAEPGPCATEPAPLVRWRRHVARAAFRERQSRVSQPLRAQQRLQC